MREEILKIEVYDEVNVADVVIDIETINHEAPVVKFHVYWIEPVFVSTLSTWAGVQIRAPGLNGDIYKNSTAVGILADGFFNTKI